MDVAATPPAPVGAYTDSSSSNNNGSSNAAGDDFGGFGPDDEDV